VYHTRATPPDARYALDAQRTERNATQRNAPNEPTLRRSPVPARSSDQSLPTDATTDVGNGSDGVLFVDRRFVFNAHIDES
jgi:hypothetical protein